MGRLNGKVAIITGAGSGIGEATAVLFAKEGAKVIVADVDLESANKTTDQIKKSGGEASSFKVDVSKSEDCKKMIEAAVDTYGKLDIIYNNAGIGGPLLNDVGHYQIEEMQKVIDINFKGVWYGVHYAAPEMVKNGGGSIISTASMAAVYGCMGGTVYGGTKSGVIGIMQSAANELGQYNIRCNCISPYVVETPLLNFLKETDEGRAELEMLKSGNQMNRLVQPIEIAYTALFLASDESKAVSGMNIRVDCGAAIRPQPYNKASFDAANQY